jgi:hypothetical protein
VQVQRSVMETQYRDHKLEQDDGLSEFERVKKDEKYSHTIHEWQIKSRLHNSACVCCVVMIGGEE